MDLSKNYEEFEGTESQESDEMSPAIFQRARSKEQIECRKKQIIDACETIFKQQGYDAVSFKSISEITSFTRQSIYKYYHSKEEIFLDLLHREQVAWETDIYAEFARYGELSKEGFAQMMTNMFVKHIDMIHLTSRIFYGIEVNCSIEKLAEFRSTSIDVYHILLLATSRYFPSSLIENRRNFASVIFAFVVGLYPMNHPSQKSLEAEKLSNAYYVYPEGYEKATAFETICYRGILFLLSGL